MRRSASETFEVTGTGRHGQGGPRGAGGLALLGEEAGQAMRGAEDGQAGQHSRTRIYVILLKAPFLNVWTFVHICSNNLVKLFTERIREYESEVL